MRTRCPSCGGRHQTAADRVKCMAANVRKRRIERVRTTRDGVERRRAEMNSDEQDAEDGGEE